MSDKYKDAVKITTPAGTAKYPRLNTPSTKFNPEGVYEIQVVLDESEKSVSEFRAKLEKLEADAHAAGKKELKPGKKLKLADSVIKPVLDDEGNEVDGKFEVKAKMKASGIRKKDNSPWTMKPAIFDAKGKPAALKVGGGSTVKVALEASPYNSPTLGCGISLRLQAVQVIDLVEFSGGQDAGAYGFGEEDGYEAPAEEAFPQNDQEPQEDAPAEDPAPAEEPAPKAGAKRARGSF